MEIKLTPEESEEYFFNAICNGLGYVTSGYGLDLDYSNEDYEEAKTKLGMDKPGIFACFEDVLLEMLRMGKTLTMVDEEGDGDRYPITIKDVHERVSKAPVTHLMNMINEEDDGETADVIIQQVFFNDIVYG